MLLPVLVAFTLGLVWLLSLAAAQVRVVDAARETARAIARDDPTTTAVAAGARVAPAGARIAIRRSPGEVRVHVVAEVKGPGGLVRMLPSVEVEAEAVTTPEPSS